MGTSIFVGIDVSKDHLDVAYSSHDDIQRFTNDQSGVDVLLGIIKPMAPELVVLEATGGDEMFVASLLVEAGLATAVVNPRQVRDFAKSAGILAKTDAIDARVIARFGSLLQPEPRPLKDKVALELTALVTRRRQIMDMLVSEKNRLATAPKRNHKDIKAHIQWLKKRLDNIEKDIHQDIQNSPVWCIKDQILQSTPGVGPATSAVLICDLPELGTLNRKKIAMLVGLAPLNRDSGKLKGRRVIWGGRAQVRSCLYMATLTAIRFNPPIKSFYERLISSGKAHKVAMTACMRKLLIMLNAMLRDNTAWQAC